MSDTSALMAVIVGYFVVFLLLCIAVYVLYVIGLWKVFTKAGVEGWKSVIPYYNIYNIFKISWKPEVFWAYLVLFIVYMVLSFVGGSIASILCGLAGIALFVLNVIMSYKLAKAFGCGIGFTIGLLIIPFVFYPILGFGSSKYLGPQE